MPRQVALSKEQCLFLIEWSGDLVGVAGQVGFFALENDVIVTSWFVGRVDLASGRSARNAS